LKPVPTLKSSVQALLIRSGLYHRVKASCLYDLYWLLADKDILAYRQREVRFYRALLKDFRPGDVVFDVGANQGYKTDIFLRMGAKIVAVEPDESNQQVLRERFLKGRLKSRPVVVVGCALSDNNGVETLWIDAPGSAKNTLNQKWVETLRRDESRFGERLSFARQKQVTTTTLDDLIVAHGRPTFIKIDVEGAEPNVLRGLHHAVPYLSFEVNLPEFRPEGLECIELLNRIAASGRFNYAVDCQGSFALTTWLPAHQFSLAFEACSEPSIEVFWTTVPS
jgi:FkbM family methyltransferase